MIGQPNTQTEIPTLYSYLFATVYRRAAGSTFPVPVCTVSSSIDRTSQCDRLYVPYRLNFLLLQGQIYVTEYMHAP